nr:hypothetical protein [Tanacetum cinerariifolium]
MTTLANKAILSGADNPYDEVNQGENVEEENLDEEKTYEEEEVNEIYNNVNINMEGRDTKMTDALLANVQDTQEIEHTHVIIPAVTLEVQQQSSFVSSGFISKMLNPNPDTSIDSIHNLNIKLTSLVDVLMNEAIKVAVQLQSGRLRVEAKTKNEDFINNIYENIKKIIKEQVKVQVKEQVSKILPRIEKSVNKQLEDEVLIRSSNKAKTSHVISANLSELELKKILIDKIENNKSNDRSVQQKTLYKALVDAYETDKDILATYGDTVTLKRCQDDEDEPPLDQTGGQKEGKLEKKLSLLSAQAKEQVHTVKDLEEPAHQEFKIGFTKDHPVNETSQLPDWFQKPTKPLTPDLDWNKTLLANNGPIQPWISTLTQNEDPHGSFNDLIDTHLDFSAFVLNRLKVDTLTLELLAGPIFKLMKGSYKSLVELEYFFKEVYKATTDQLDWNNPEGQQYPHDLCKPLPLIPNSRGRRVIPFYHFINNDLAYLSGGSQAELTLLQ